jgi:17beta-estradiol 17-dehydrogenase / very-long-chain 3-oxoacyl-CoA reductase
MQALLKRVFDTNCWCTTCFAVLGAFVLLRFAFRVACFAWLHFIKPKSDLSKYGAKRGAWAIVTGATDGIGKGYVQALAKRGFNVVLVSRTADKLRAVAEETEKECKVQTRVVPCDASDVSAANIERVRAAVNDLDVGVLVNNVGVNTSDNIPADLLTTKSDDIDAMIRVNCSFGTHLTRALIPLLQRRAAAPSGGRALVLNLSSVAGQFPAPLMAVYSATKAFDMALSSALRIELRPMGIDVVGVVPHYVQSNMSGMRPSFHVPSAKRFASDSLSKVGCGVVTPYWPHAAMAAVMSCLPRSYINNKSFGMMKAARTRLIARRERTAKTQ